MIQAVEMYGKVDSELREYSIVVPRVDGQPGLE
jgi:hypothetical protein